MSAFLRTTAGFALVFIALTGAVLSPMASAPPHRVNGAPVPQTQYVNGTTLKAAAGAALKALLPKGQAVQITVVNNDDGGVSAPFSFTR